MSSYRLVGRLESGELAELYRGTRDGRTPVTVKLFHARTSDADYLRDLAGTARHLGAARHPGVVHVLDLGLVQKRLAVVQEAVGKVNLGQALTRLNTKEVLLAPNLAVAMVLELLDAMGHAHGAGVLHGALTPGNVILSSEGRPAICDFGALKALEAAPALARQFGQRGRSSYRAPEVMRGDPVTVESDLYSVGAIAYELLTLKEASSGAEQNVSTRRGAIPPPSRVDRRLNPRLDPILLRALEANPARRFRSAKDFAQALREFLAQNGGLPSREEQRRFVGSLFPAEVNLDHLGPVPFAEPFTLTELSGAALEPLDERALALTPRVPFSGGEVDAAAVTQSSMPALADAPEPQTTPESALGESAELPSWDAPSAAAAPGRRADPKAGAEAAQRALERRVKVIEDFQPLEKPAAQAGADSGPVPRVPFTLPTAEMPLQEKMQRDTEQREYVPFVGGPMRVVTEERLIRAQAWQRKKIGAWALVVAAAGAAAFFFLVLRNTRVALPGFAPAPPSRAKAPKVEPTPEPKRAPEPKPEPKPPPRDEPVAQAPREACYDGPPRKKAAFLTVATGKRVVVRVDGVRVCGGGLAKIPIEAGRRKISVSEGRGTEPFEATMRFETGKEARVVPVFRAR